MPQVQGFKLHKSPSRGSECCLSAYHVPETLLDNRSTKTGLRLTLNLMSLEGEINTKTIQSDKRVLG